MVEPMSTATALQSPSWRRNVGAACGEAEVVMRQCYWPGAPQARGKRVPVRVCPVASCPAPGDIIMFPYHLSAPLLRMRLSFANGLFWTSVACCVIAQLFIIRSVRGARYVPGPSAGMPRQRGGLELLWVVLPAIGLALLLLFTWWAMQESGAPRSSPPIATAKVRA
jgi:hypothetical protein